MLKTGNMVAIRHGWPPSSIPHNCRTCLSKIIRAWANGDGMAFFNLLADTAIWTVMGSCPISGTYIGRQRLVEDVLAPQCAKLAGPPTPTLLNLIAEGDMVVIQWVGKGTTNAGQPYNNSYCYVVHMENGKVTRGTAYLDTELVRSIW